MRPNLLDDRVRVTDTKSAARRTFETFHARPHEREIPMKWGWPSYMIQAGEGRAELYNSNKWQENRRHKEPYKHIVESNRTVYVTPGFVVKRQGRSPLPICGDAYIFQEPMPREFSYLGELRAVQLQLFDCRGKRPRLSTGDDNKWEIDIALAHLGAAVHPKTKETLLFVYTEADGVRMLMTGEELAIEKDGIVG